MRLAPLASALKRGLAQGLPVGLPLAETGAVALCGVAGVPDAAGGAALGVAVLPAATDSAGNAPGLGSLLLLAWYQTRSALALALSVPGTSLGAGWGSRKFSSLGAKRSAAS